MTDNEKLIEAACEAMHVAYEAAAVREGWETQERSRKPWADVPDANKRTMRSAVAAALAVFEKAHTPTDDERGALAYLITAHRFRERGLTGVIGEPDIAVARPLAEFLLSEGIRRYEPSRDPGWSHPEAVYSPEVFMTIQGLLDEARGEPMHALRLAVSRKLSEPQGEPSDALNLDYLEAVANAATPGPWTDFDDDGEAYSRPPATGAFLVEYGADAEQKMRDIRYIASVDPQTILALIALARTAVTEQGENR